MGIRDLFFGKEEEEEEDDLNPQAKERPVAKVKPGNDDSEFGFLENTNPVAEKSVLDAPVEVTPPVSSKEVEAELKELRTLMEQERKEKNLGAEYFGFLKALGNEDDSDAHQRTLRTLNAVREQFSVGSTLTWKMLIDSAKSCMSWLSTHTNQKVSKLQADRQSANANFALQIQKAEMAIQENEEKILRLQKEIEVQKSVKQTAEKGQKMAESDFEKKKNTIDTASVQMANDIATDIARFQGES